MGTEQRILRVIAHIHDNLDGDLDLDTLADIAALSRFHFHRVYTAITGETVAATIRRNRLGRATGALAAGSQPVAEIARQCGYDNPAAFGRAFRAAYGVTPGAWRRGARSLPDRLAASLPASLPASPTQDPLATPNPEDPDMFPIDTLTAPDRLAIGLPHRGAYMTVGASFEKLGAIIATRGLGPQVQGMVAVYFDDPDAVPEADLRSLCAYLAAPGAPVPEGLTAELLPGGRFAVMRHRGPYAGLRASYRHLYGSWLPASGAEPRDTPPFEVYLNTPADTAPADLLTEIWLPLA
jgi:AraC family transcriptional regulator